MHNLKIVSNLLLEAYQNAIDFEPLAQIELKSKEAIPFDYFQFYTSISSVYSSKIEGEQVDMDSYMKHKFLNVKYEPDYTKKADDLFKAYEFVEKNELTAANIVQAHTILSENLLAASQRGRIRVNPMFVLNEDDRIEYVASAPNEVKSEWDKLFLDIETLRKAELDTTEIFYYAAYIHLLFLKIHPMQDGNGRTARLLEKWFLREKLGQIATSIELEKNYYRHKSAYYTNLRKIGLEYERLDYTKALDFLLMTILGLNKGLIN